MTGIPSSDGICVLPAAASDRAAVTEILADAFATDEHTVKLLPDAKRPERLRRLFDNMIREAFAAGGHVWIAVDSASGQRLGAALWEAPGKKPPTWLRIAHAVSYVRVFGDRLGEAFSTDQVAIRHRPMVPHWYLKDIGTSPDARGRGVGAALLNHRLADADSGGIGAYLESSSRANVGFYSRFGFTERSVIPAVGTTDLIGMWREPVQQTSSASA
jgi:GNAT superfamily N-acetyltransferase